MPPVPHPLRCGLAFLAWIAVAANPLRIHSQEALTPASEPVEPASVQQPIQSESTSPSTDLRQPNSVDFNRHIQPILAEHCFQCHGPDADQRAADLRLDIEADAKRSAIRVGVASESPLVHRIESTDPDACMPPPSTGKALTSDQKQLLKRWIDSGAPFAQHWAFQPIADAASLLDPLVATTSPDASPIDRFLQHRLAASGLEFAPEISRSQFIRHATFDLTGLPPTWSEVQSFLNDTAPGHLERLIDRLLDSPRYGERWGRHWLDIARYADTHGGAAIGFTSFPFSYTYRDYVINAMNADLPFDRFLIEQIAADQLGKSEGDPSLAALGFLTVGMQFRNDHDTIDDQIDVITRGLLGLTVTCARCHDHKFDAIPTSDYYALYATIAPSKSPSELPAIGESSDANARVQYQQQLQDLAAKHEQFSREQSEILRNRLRMQVGLYLVEIARGAKEQDISTQFLSYRTDDMRPLVLNRWLDYLQKRSPEDPVFGPWLAMQSIAQLPPEEFAKQCQSTIERMSGELLAAGSTPEQLHALRAEPPRWNPLILDALRSRVPNSLVDVAETYGQVFAAEQKLWLQSLLDASLEATPGGTIIPDDHPQHTSLHSPSRRQLRDHLYGPNTPFDLSNDEASRLTNRTISDLISGKRGAIHQLNLTAPGSPPRAMIVQEEPQPKDQFVFLRGNPLTRGDHVQPRFLTALSSANPPHFENGKRRLGLANAIVADSNPLTRRVLVNWVWQNHFGAGLVRTPDDFGTRGQPPTHPELLDYLADTLRQNNWSIKWLHKQIMLSRAYRQAATEIESARLIDPDNESFWRMPRRRLDFESMRDAMLAVSQELDVTLGGRPVDLSTTPTVPRRSVYGFINRDIIANWMSTFDAANPNACTAKRPETNVPQQTLFALNSDFIQDRAARLASLSLATPHASDESRIADLFQRTLSRDPTEADTQLALRFLRDARADSASTDVPSTDAPSTDASPAVPERHWIQLAHALLASNEFTFLD